MDALTPDGPLFRTTWFLMRVSPPSGLPAYFVVPSIRSVSKHPMPFPRSSGIPSRDSPSKSYVEEIASSRTERIGLRHFPAGSPRQQAESSSSTYGPDVRLRLLSTPPRGDAVTFGYEKPDIPRRGLAPRRYDNITGALERAFQAQRWSDITSVRMIRTLNSFAAFAG